MEKFPEIKKSFQDVYGDKEYPKDNIDIPKVKPGQQEKSLRDLAEDEIGWLKDKLRPEEYKEILDNRVREFKESEEENQMLEEKVTDLNLAKIDTTTGMKLRRYFFSEAIPNILKANSDIKFEEMDDEKWTELLMGENEELLEKISPLTMSVIDLSYLNLANRDGHIYGDQLLETLGKEVSEVQETKKYGSRIGGDEFAFLFDNEELAKEKMGKLKDGFSSIEMSNLEKAGLDPNLDVGSATFGEAVEVFQEIMKTKSAKERISKEKVFKEFSTIWMMIADKKSLMAKAQTRIPILMEHFQFGYNLDLSVRNEKYAKKYDQLFGYLGKGGYEISKERLAEMIENSGGDSYKRDELIAEFILEKEQRKLGIEKPDYDRLRDYAIADKVGIVDLDEVTIKA